MRPGVFLQQAAEILPIASDLLLELKQQHLKSGRKSFLVRLIGIRCSNFLHEADKEHRTQKGMYDFLNKIPNGEKAHDATPRLPETTIICQPKSTLVLTGNRTPSVRKLDDYLHLSKEKSEGRIEKGLPIGGQADQSCAPNINEKGQCDCPLCGRALLGDNALINAHIDSCLSSSIVKDVARQESQSAELRKRKCMSALNGFFRK